jgi:hypothetical protein
VIECVVARDLMLEAEPAELEGRGDSELARHLAGCGPCGAAARAILAAERELGRALLATTPRRDASEAVRAGTRRAAHHRWLWGATPLAAAAVVALVLLGRRGVPGLPGVPGAAAVAPSPRRAAPGSDIAVVAPPGQSVAVLRTDNPEIVVIWFFSREQP